MVALNAGGFNGSASQRMHLKFTNKKYPCQYLSNNLFAKHSVSKIPNIRRLSPVLT